MKRICNHTFFDNIDSERKAYWFGFIAADGYLTNKRNTLQVKLSTTDNKHLHKMKTDLQSNHLIYECKKYSQLRIDSKHMANSLRNMGIFSAKTFNLSWNKLVNNMENNVINHFIRGYFDGDGCWGSKGPKYPNSVVFTITCASKDFSEGLFSYFLRKDIHIGKYVSKSGIYRLQTASKEKCVCLYNYMYNNSEVFLDRKFNKANQLFGRI